MKPTPESGKPVPSPRTQGIANVLASVSRMYGEIGRRRRQAVALEQAGYVRRRKLTTLEEIHELPDSSVVYPKDTHAPMERLTGGWYMPLVATRFVPDHTWLPAIVLWDPREEEPQL